MLPDSVGTSHDFPQAMPPEKHLQLQRHAHRKKLRDYWQRPAWIVVWHAPRRCRQLTVPHLFQYRACKEADSLALRCRGCRSDRFFQPEGLTDHSRGQAQRRPRMETFDHPALKGRNKSA